MSVVLQTGSFPEQRKRRPNDKLDLLLLNYVFQILICIRKRKGRQIEHSTIVCSLHSSLHFPVLKSYNPPFLRILCAYVWSVGDFFLSCKSSFAAPFLGRTAFSDSCTQEQKQQCRCQSETKISSLHWTTKTIHDRLCSHIAPLFFIISSSAQSRLTLFATTHQTQISKNKLIG